MTRKTIRHFFTAYPNIKDQLDEDKPELIIRKNGRKKKIILVAGACKMKEYLEIVLANETDPFVREILTKNIVDGVSDLEIIAQEPISESTFYRWKRSLTERIYELYILDGYVTRQEILQDSISDIR